MLPCTVLPYAVSLQLRLPAHKCYTFLAQATFPLSLWHTLEGGLWELILLCLLSVQDHVNLASVCRAIRHHCKQFKPHGLVITGSDSDEATDLEEEQFEFQFVRQLVSEQRHTQLSVLHFRQEQQLGLAWYTLLGFMPSLTNLQGIMWKVSGIRWLPCSLTQLSFAHSPGGGDIDCDSQPYTALEPFTRLQKLKLPVAAALVVRQVPPSVHTLHMPYVYDSGQPMHKGIVDLHLCKVTSWKQMQQIVQLPSLKKLRIDDISRLPISRDTAVCFRNMETLVIPPSPSWKYVNCAYVSNPSLEH